MPDESGDARYILITVVYDIMLPAVLAVFHCFRWYYIFSGLAAKGLKTELLNRLRKLGIYSLNRQRLPGDVETFKIITRKEHVNWSNFFSCQMSPADSEDIR